MLARMAVSTLLRMKYMFVNWGHNKSVIKVESEACPRRLLIAGKEIVKAKVNRYELVLEWSDGKWETWDALQTSSEILEIKIEVRNKLTNAREHSESKGKGRVPNRVSRSTWIMFHPHCHQRGTPPAVKAAATLAHRYVHILVTSALAHGMSRV